MAKKVSEPVQYEWLWGFSVKSFQDFADKHGVPVESVRLSYRTTPTYYDDVDVDFTMEAEVEEE